MNKIIHQIWVGPNKMAVRERRCCRLVKSKNPNWDYMFWDDSNLPKLPKDIQTVYDYFGETKQYTFQADVLRLFILREYGGLYIDVDFEPHTSFDGLEKLDNLFLVWGPGQKRIMNGAIGANQNDSTIVDLCSKINMTRRFYGPDWHGDNVKHDEVNTMPFEEFQERYAIHHHLNSWMT